MSLCLIESHVPVCDQPAYSDRRASGSTCFAMDIDNVILLDMLFDKGDATLNVLKRRRVKIHCWNPKLLHAKSVVLRRGA